MGFLYRNINPINRSTPLPHPPHLRPHKTSPPHRHPNLPPLLAQSPCSRPTPPPPSPQPPEIFSSRYSTPPQKKTLAVYPLHPVFFFHSNANHPASPPTNLRLKRSFLPPLTPFNARPRSPPGTSSPNHPFPLPCPLHHLPDPINLIDFLSRES